MKIVFSSMKTVLSISLQIVPQRTGINDEDEEKKEEDASGKEEVEYA